MNMIHNTYLIKVPVGRKICSSQFNIYCGFSYSGQLFLQHSLATWKLQRSEKSNNAFTNWFKYFDSFPTPCHILEHSILFWLLLGTHCNKCQPNWKIEPMSVYLVHCSPKMNQLIFPCVKNRFSFFHHETKLISVQFIFYYSGDGMEIQRRQQFRSRWCRQKKEKQW